MKNLLKIIFMLTISLALISEGSAQSQFDNAVKSVLNGVDSRSNYSPPQSSSSATRSTVYSVPQHQVQHATVQSNVDRNNVYHSPQVGISTSGNANVVSQTFRPSPNSNISITEHVIMEFKGNPNVRRVTETQRIFGNQVNTEFTEFNQSPPPIYRKKKD